MKNIFNLFKNRLIILFCLVFFILLFTPVLTANEPATGKSVGWVERSETQQSNPQSEVQNPQLDKASFALKTAKLHMPFIANNGQMDGLVKFYAKTFGGTVFVTKEGEIVYALPMNSSELRVQGSECRGEWHSPNHVGWVKGNAPNKENIKDGFATLNPSYVFDTNHISDIVHPASWIVDHDKPEFRNPKSAIQNDAVRHPECNEGSLVMKRDSSPSAQNDREEPAFQNPKSEISGVALREEFVGAKVKAIQGEEPSVTKVSYFKGNDPSKWKTNISTYDAVNLGEIYDGIELKLRAYGNNVEKLFCVKPGADPEQIKIRLSGLKDCGVQNAEITHPLVPSREGINQKSDASTSLSMTSFRAESRNQNQKLQINNAGELEVETELGLVKFTKPVAYQEINGKRVEVECKYTIEDCGMQNAECKTNLKSKIVRLSAHDEVRNPNHEIKNLQSENPKSAIQNQKFEYGFAVASYDRTKPLIIDPLLASTYLGGTNDDYGYSLALDTSGNVYVTGYTYSTDFPTTLGAYDTSYSGGDVFVSKLDGGLTSLLASTYLGGSDEDLGYSLALDTSGDVYVMGITSSTDFPTTSGAYDPSHNNGGPLDVFVSKLNSGLTRLLASTYLGGTDNDYSYGNSLTLATGGNVYVTGYTYSTDFPTTLGAYDTSFNGSSDVFVSKLDGGLSSLLASTYLGGSSVDSNEVSIALDTSGDVFVTGSTSSTDFPTTSGAYDTSYNGGVDVFVSKLDSGLTSLLAYTYLGGSDYDYVNSLALDTSGNVYVTGKTSSSNFPTTSGAYDTSFSGNSDVFVSKLNSGLTSLLASTYLGGSSYNEGSSLVLDTSGDVYVAGFTTSSDFPATSGAYDTSFNGSYEDVFVSKLDGGLSSLLASTYLGGSDYDYGSSLTLDTGGDVYVTGHTYSTDFPHTSGVYNTSQNGSYDVFVSKLDGKLSADDITCKADNIDVDPGDIEVQTGNSADETITITCADTVTPVSGEKVKAKVKTGKDKVTVSPGSAVTDEKGQAVFIIQGVKEGKAKVEFKDAAAGLKVKVKVTVVE